LIGVPQGGRVCVIIEDANPVLYSYSVGSKAVTVDPDQETSTIIAGLKKFLSPESGKALGFTGNSPLDNIDRYSQRLGAIYSLLLTMQDERSGSDGVADFSVTATKIGLVADSVKKLDKAAEEAFNSFPDDDKQKNMVVRLLRAKHEELRTAVNALSRQFATGRGHLELPCVPVNKDRLQVTLAIQPIGDTPAKDKRVRLTGDAIVTIQADPISTRAVEVGAGFVVSALIRGQKQFDVRDNIVVGQDDAATQFRPAAYLMARAWGPQWLWGTIGFSADTKGVSDLFFGLSGRFGGSIVGTRMTLGVGLALSRVVTGLSKGAEGAPLPPNVKDISEITEQKLRPGLGIALMLSGLD
jgi:hypothetical protein